MASENINTGYILFLKISQQLEHITIQNYVTKCLIQIFLSAYQGSFQRHAKDRYIEK